MARKQRKAIVSCAVTGAIHVPSLTPHLPITPEQIAEQAIGAAEAGAAILHLHARNPSDGRPTPDPDVYAQFVGEIHERTDAVVNITTGGGLGMSLEERLAAVRRFDPELCSLNMGSFNFGIFPMAAGIAEFKHDWEKPYLEGTTDFIFKNTFADIETIVTEIGERGTRFEFECYDVGHLYNLAHFLERGVLKPPLFVQCILGILGGVGAIMGGNVRVGLEDSVYLEKGRLAETNAQQVEKIVRILRELSLDVATPDDAREMLGLKGRDNTALAGAVASEGRSG